MNTENRTNLATNDDRPSTNLFLFVVLGSIFWVEAVLFIRFWGENLFGQWQSLATSLVWINATDRLGVNQTKCYDLQGGR